MLYDWFKHIEFAYPKMLSLFTFLPVLIWWYVKKYNRKQGALKISTTHSFTVSSFKNTLRHLPFVLRLLALSCIILALARPRQHRDEQLRRGEGIDIVICIDVSGSMLSQDFHRIVWKWQKKWRRNLSAAGQLTESALLFFPAKAIHFAPLQLIRIL